VPPSFTSSLNISFYLFPGDTSQARLITPKGFYALRKDIVLLESYKERTWYGDCRAYTQIILEEIGQLPDLYLIVSISFWDNS
jgi:hypothetical protein